LSARAFRLASRHGENFAVQACSQRFSRCQKIRHDRWAQNQRENRKCVLGRAWGNRCSSRHSTHSSRFDNQEERGGNLSSAMRLFVLDYYRSVCRVKNRMITSNAKPGAALW
jgi:hypothetical protein